VVRSKKMDVVQRFRVQRFCVLRYLALNPEHIYLL
jgi:hypothetical protein